MSETDLIRDLEADERHTPGPWFVGNREKTVVVGDPEGVILFRLGPHPPLLRDADLRLIAAAPDMLALLKLALGDAEYVLSRGFWDEVRAAIAKAEGKS